jgi:tetratricopeptide (TPR) repeat protein
VAPVAGEAFEAPAANGADREVGPRELFLDAALALNYGRYSKAAGLLERVVDARPDHAAAHFCLAYCLQQAGRYQRALERYDVARALRIADPRPAYQRGTIYGLLKRPDLAEVEFGKALVLDPNHADAYRYRALARYRLGAGCGKEKASAEHLAGADADLTAALAQGAPPLFVYFVRARVREARGDRDGANADRAAAREREPVTEADFIVSGWSRITSDPKGARADFEKAIELNPRSLVALQNLAHVLAEQLKDNETALAVTTKVAERYPEFGPAVAGHAIVLARLGRREAAHKAIDRARQLSDDAEVTYQAASVYALTSVRHPDDRSEALALLRRALLREGYNNVRGLGTDPDLAPIRDTREFREIQQAATVLHK